MVTAIHTLGDAGSEINDDVKLNSDLCCDDEHSESYSEIDRQIWSANPQNFYFPLYQLHPDSIQRGFFTINTA